MTTRAKITTTVLLLAGLTAVGIADYQLAGREYAAELIAEQPTDTGSGTGVVKAGETNPEDVLRALAFTIQPTEDLTFLTQVAQNQQVQSIAVLQNGDRVGSVSWIDGDAKGAFIALKEALLRAFSSGVTGLSDTTEQIAGRPVRNILTFKDPALSEETLTFVRVRERLYEFHTATGKETAMTQIVDALTAR